MSELTPRPDPATPTRVVWTCPNCQTQHILTEPRDEALETARNLLAEGVTLVILEDATAAEMREADHAEHFARLPHWVVEIPVNNPERPWWDVRRYRK